MTNCPTCDSPAPNLHPAVQHEGEVQPCDDEFHDEYRQRTGESLADMSRRLYGDRTTGPAHYPLIPLRRPRVTPPDRHPEDTMKKNTQTAGATGQGAQVIAAAASTDCPSCGGFTGLSGSGRQGQQIQLTGTCPNGHSVFFNHTVQ